MLLDVSISRQGFDRRTWVVRNVLTWTMAYVPNGTAAIAHKKTIVGGKPFVSLVFQFDQILMTG